MKMLMKAGMPGSVAESSGIFPHARLRRLRSSPHIRNLFQETTVGLDDLICPIFVEEETGDFGAIDSGAGISRIKLGGQAVNAAEAGADMILSCFAFDIAREGF
jgi:porphobilinogen synthase